MAAEGGRGERARRGSRQRSNASAQLLTFAAVGVVATTAHFLVMIVLVEALRVQPVPASCAGAIIGAFVSYRLNYVHTFRSTQRHRVAVARFAVVAFAAFVANGAILAALLAALPLPYVVAQAATTLAVMAMTFTAGRLWAFRA